MTLRSDLTSEVEKALRNEAYDGGSGPLNEVHFTRYVRRLAEAAVEVFEEVREPSAGRVEAVARRLFGSTVDSMTRARELAHVVLLAEPLVECPHWAPGKITFRNRCTACSAVTEQGEGR